MRGSIHVRPHEIESKPYFRDKLLLLVGSAYGDSALEEVCASLRTQGVMSAAILEGGLRSVAGRGLDLVGSAPEIPRIPARSLLERVGVSDWLVLNFDSAVIPKLPICAEVMSLESADPALSQALTDALARHEQSHSRPYVAVTSDTEAQYATLQRLVHDLSPASRIYFVDGGNPALEGAIHLASSIRAGKPRVPLHQRCHR